MSSDDRGVTYAVHIASDVATALDIDSPIRTDRIDYYDSGLWVATAAGRDFFPYAHVLTIRERPAATEADPAAQADEA